MIKYYEKLINEIFTNVAPECVLIEDQLCFGFFFMKIIGSKKNNLHPSLSSSLMYIPLIGCFTIPEIMAKINTSYNNFSHFKTEIYQESQGYRNQ